ncbi:SIR2 family protein [Leptospira neocaledonica]|uniref:Uncharacterized protein n=1 Tax=Leptospira neocaledonica TaxID=2023192 RepID=A0A2N0A3J6_9LEPT|nr:SIR2 family protein [Leptospira neocaledonica]PJZ78791.1 hypothetical protein CH365_00735 [Leptospira neocaledonica]
MLEKIDKIEEMPDFPSGIEPSQQSIAFFIGAGVSRLIGCPGWDQFARQLAEQAADRGILSYHDCDLINQMSDNRMKIGAVKDKYKEKKLEQDFLIAFKELLDPRIKDRNNSSLIKNISVYETLKYFSAVFPRLVYITTNADIYFNEEFKIFPKDKIPTPDSSEDRFNGDTLYRIHGSIREGEESSLIFSLKDYINQYSKKNYTTTFLEEILINSDVIFFIGYSLSEIELLKYIIEPNNKRYWLKGYFQNQTGLANIENATYESMGITIIPFAIDTFGHRQLMSVLSNWYSQLVRSTELIPKSQREVDDAIRITESEN